MFIEIVVIFVHSLPEIRFFIRDVVKNCKKNNCLVSKIKNIFKSDWISAEQLNWISANLTEFSQNSFLETFLCLLKEFHIHTTSHLQSSEQLCLYHTYFANLIIAKCECTETFINFPVVYANSLPIIIRNYEKDSAVYSIFSRIFDYSKNFASCTCHSFIKLIPKSLSEYLILSIYYSNSISPLLVYSSIPSSFESAQFFESKFDKSNEKYNLCGYLLIDANSRVYFLRFNENTKDCDLITNDMSRTRISFVKAIEMSIGMRLIPFVILYSKSFKSFDLDVSYFTYLERKTNDTVLNNKVIYQLGNAISLNNFKWKCENCESLLIKLDCPCGYIYQNRNNWRCSCGKILSEDKCLCGNGKKYCKVCGEIADFFECECRRCGGQVRLGGNCNVCGFGVHNICEICYEKLVFCPICRYLNKENYLLCERCMNPVPSLFNNA